MCYKLRAEPPHKIVISDKQVLSTKSNNKGLYYSELLCSVLYNQNMVCVCYDGRLKSWGGWFMRAWGHGQVLGKDTFQIYDEKSSCLIWPKSQYNAIYKWLYNDNGGLSMRYKIESFSATQCHSSFVLSTVPLYNGLPRTMTYKHTCVSVWTIHGEPDSDVITDGKYESLNSSG